MKIGVFCSCSENVSPMLFSEMEALGEELARLGHDIVYGGSHAGCMGSLGIGVKRGGGRLIGVVPEMDFMAGLVEEKLDERHVVPTLSSRKVKMLELADAFLVYPGGLGTLDEAFEAMAMKSCGGLDKPIVFYNFLGIWTPLLESMELLTQQRLIRDSMDDLIKVIDRREQLKDCFNNGR